MLTPCLASLIVLMLTTCLARLESQSRTDMGIHNEFPLHELYNSDILVAVQSRGAENFPQYGHHFRRAVTDTRWVDHVEGWLSGVLVWLSVA